MWHRVWGYMNIVCIEMHIYRERERQREREREGERERVCEGICVRQSSVEYLNPSKPYVS